MGIAFVDSKSFVCPSCHVHSTFVWGTLDFESVVKHKSLSNENSEIVYLSGIKTARCSNCGGQNYWVKIPKSSNWSMIYPSCSPAPLPDRNLPEDCKKDYLEAAEIAQKSPRGAAALLRLCIQKLCVVLGEENKDLNESIGNLVKNQDLNKKIQQALDVVRVVGNNSVHPGQISVDDNPELVSSLFKLVNLIVEEMITRPNEIQEMYNSLPKGTLERIKRRDKK